MVASTRTEIRDDGLVGVLCAPAGDLPAPGVLLLGGSEGGLHERDARALAAAEGFTVVASQPRAGQRFGVTGGSRGGEAALLVGSYDERVGAVVSIVGSGVMTQGHRLPAGQPAEHPQHADGVVDGGG